MTQTKIERDLLKVETYVVGTPGTMLGRVLMDTTLLKQYKLKPPKKELHNHAGDYPRDPLESALVWSLSVGRLMAPKMFFYGWTPTEAIQKALAYLKKAKGKQNRIKLELFDGRGH